MSKRTCSIDGCDRPHRARGWCNAHYTRWATYGDPLGAADKSKRRFSFPRHTPRHVRFWTRVDQHDPSGCWVWLGPTRSSGYGGFWDGERNVPAHRWAYESQVGAIPEGAVLDHLCRTRLCVNPAHLEPVTNRENTLRGNGLTASNAVKTHCPKGHEFTAANTYVIKGWRTCRECKRVASLEYKARLRAKRALEAVGLTPTNPEKEQT